MGDHVDPNHLRYEKLRILKQERIERKQDTQKKIDNANLLLHSKKWVQGHNANDTQTNKDSEILSDIKRMGNGHKEEFAVPNVPIATGKRD
jgi:hypothetical protein